MQQLIEIFYYYFPNMMHLKFQENLVNVAFFKAISDKIREYNYY